jgi:hypothetical protein
MLFRSSVPALFQQMAMNLDRAANNSRKLAAAKRLDFYHDVQYDYIVDALKVHFANYTKLTPFFINIVKKIVNNLAMVYAQDAVREVAGTDRDREIFKEVMDTSGLPLKMKLCSRYVKLLKTCLIRPLWRKGHLDLDVLTGEILDVVCGDTPEDLQQILITHYPESLKQDEIEYSHWTAGEISRLDYRANVIGQEENIYGVLPFIPLWDRTPTTDFWLSGGDDLIYAQEGINEKLTDLLYIMRMQGFGVGWMKKDGPSGGNMVIDPGTLIELPKDGAIGYESQKAPIRDILEAISFLIAQAAISNGLSVSTLSTKVVRESGVAKTQQMRELSELRAFDIILWRKYERQLFEMIRVVWNVHNPGRKISPEAKLSCDFYEPKEIISSKDRALTWKELKALGVISSVDVAMERNPDLKSREEAIEFLQRVKEENQLFGSVDNANVSQ